MIKFLFALPRLLFEWYFSLNADVVLHGFIPGAYVTKQRYLRSPMLVRATIVLIASAFAAGVPLFAGYLGWSYGRFLRTDPPIEGKLYMLGLAIVIFAIVARSQISGIRNLPWIFKNLLNK